MIRSSVSDFFSPYLDRLYTASCYKLTPPHKEPPPPLFSGVKHESFEFPSGGSRGF